MDMLDRLTQLLDSLPRIYGIPGCDLLVMQRHRVVYRHQAGYCDLQKKVPVTDDRLYPIWSMSKLFTVTAAFQLMEQDLLHMDDPVSLYLPEYADLTVETGNWEISSSAVSFGQLAAEGQAKGAVPCEEPMRIRHLLTMTAGLDYNMDFPLFGQMLAEKGQSVTTRDIAAAFARKSLSFSPGTHFQYSVCHDILAAVIEVITGERFRDYVRRKIALPLGIRHLYYQMTEEIQDRAAPLYLYGERGIVPYEADELRLSLPEFDSGGAGVITTTEDYALLMDALANQGIGAGGNRILRQESIDLMRENSLGPVQQTDFRAMCRYGYSYGYGVRTLIHAPMAESRPGEFGWDGACGAYCMAEPSQGLSLVYMQNVLKYKEVFLTVHPLIRDLVCRALAEKKGAGE